MSHFEHNFYEVDVWAFGVNCSLFFGIGRSFITELVCCWLLLLLPVCATAGQEDPFELDSNLSLSSGRHGEDRKRQYLRVRPWNTATWRFGWLTVILWYCISFFVLFCQQEFTFSDFGFLVNSPVDLSLTAFHVTVWCVRERLEVCARLIWLVTSISSPSYSFCAPRLWFVHRPKAFVDHSFSFLSEVCVCPLNLLFPFGIAGLWVVCVFTLNTCNRTGHWQPGSLAGVAHLLERNTDVPRTAPWGQKPLLEFKGKSCLNLCTLSTSTQCLKYV